MKAKKNTYMSYKNMSAYYSIKDSTKKLIVQLIFMCNS